MQLKAQNGITLVAVIITIVILLMVSIVAISGVKNNEMLGYAENATSQFEQAQGNESGHLQGYANLLDNQNTQTDAGKKILKISMGEDVPYGDLQHLEEYEWFDETNPTAPYTTTALRSFEYEEGMTWRQWVNSEYSPGGLEIGKCFDFGLFEEVEAIVVSGTATGDSCLAVIYSWIDAYYSDAACTQLVEINEYVGKVSISYDSRPVNIDEKIEDTIARLKEEIVEECEGIYRKETNFLSFAPGDLSPWMN